ncbi:MAG: ABC transporter permease [Verrucomicrobiota bacterium]
MAEFETAPPPNELEKGSSLGRDAWIRLSKNRLAMICLFLFVGITIFCFSELITRPLGWSKNPDANELTLRSKPPSLMEQAAAPEDLDEPGQEIKGTYWFGSDSLGRDIFARIRAGGQISLAVGFMATLVSMTIGVIYGTISGYIGGRTDALMMRIVDIGYALPFTLIVILLGLVFGRAIWLIFLAIGAVEWLTMARIVRGQVLSLKKQEFVEAAVSLGYGHWRIMFRHLIPNVTGPVIVYTTLTVPAVMRLEAVLSFLGLGVQPPRSSWGTLIKEGADQMQSEPWLLLFPALFFSATLFCLNFLGDGLRDALDPKSSKD